MIAVLLIGSLLNASASQSVVFGMAVDFSHHIVIALLVGVVVGAIWSRLWPMLAATPMPTSRTWECCWVCMGWCVTLAAAVCWRY